MLKLIPAVRNWNIGKTHTHTHTSECIGVQVDQFLVELMKCKCRLRGKARVNLRTPKAPTSVETVDKSDRQPVAVF